MIHLVPSRFGQARSSLAGEVRIGAGESLSFHCISEIVGKIRREYPDIRFSITSGDTEDLTEQLENGLLDAALVFTEYDHSQYQGISLPEKERLGLLMRKDDPLAEKDAIPASVLRTLPLIIPRAGILHMSSMPEFDGLNIVAVYNLIYNASLLVEDGVGYAVGFEGLINVGGDSHLTFRPLENLISQAGTVIWRKYEVFTQAVNLFLEHLKKM